MNLKLAFRTLRKTPSVTIIAVISLALGIGATSAIFSLFNQILLQPLPVPESARLVNLSAPGPKPGSQSCNDAGDCQDVFSYRMFRDLESAQTVFTGIAAHRIFGANLAANGQTMSGQGMLVSGSYFQVLELKPAIGRLISPEDDKSVGQSPVVVLSHAYWHTRFHDDPGVLGQSLTVNGTAMAIIGVAPAGFDGTTLGTKPEVYVPITMRGFIIPGFKAFENRRNYWAYLFARLKPGVSLEQARTALNGPYHSIVNDVEVPLQQDLTAKAMARFKDKAIRLDDGRRGQSSLHENSRAPLILLMSVTGFVLLIACANVANLLLARSAARSGEMAVRLSIGANRRQLITQLLTEACLLAAFGGVAGLAVARWTLDLISSLLPSEAAATLQFRIDPTSVLFAAIVTLGTGILFGLFPALHTTRPDILSALKGQSGQPSGARAASRFRTGLATVQIALSMMLLVSAGLFTRSLLNISRVNLGIKTEKLVTFGVSPDLNGYTPVRSIALYQRIEEEFAAQPGISGVTASAVPLLANNNWGNDVDVQGFTPAPDADTNSATNEVGPGYFKTIGIPLIAGREFTVADAAGAPKVAVVNEEFTKKFNLGHDAVGKRMKAGSKELDIEIVGVARNAKYSDVKKAVPPLYFLPYRQNEAIRGVTFYVRTTLDEGQLLSAIQPLMARMDPNLPVENLRTMNQQVRENIGVDRVISVLSAAFAALATVLAAVGLYGVLAYTVAQRTREFGLRMALGAAPSLVRGMVLRQVGWMTGIGGVIGLAAAIGLGRLAESLLFEMKGSDPIVLVVSALLLGTVAVGAGFIPAHRASKVDPMRALRYE